jgi:hypothetical protein
LKKFHDLANSIHPRIKIELKFSKYQIELTLTPKPYGIDFLTVFGWSDRLWRYICLSVGFSYSFVFKNPLSKTIMVSKNSIWLTVESG